MRRSSLHYTPTVLLLLLAAGLVLAGCDSAGPNGNDESDAFEYPSTNYGAETVANLLAFDLGVRVGNVSDNSETVLDELYTGAIGDKTVPTSGISAQQSTYGDIAGGVNLSSLVSTEDLMRSDQLDPQDTPNPGSATNTDEMLKYYFEKAGAEDSSRTSNGIVLSQFAEKMLLGTPIYGKGAAILSDFANGNISSDRAEQWDAAFGYFGFPRTLEPFLDYSGGGEGLASGPAQDLNDDGAVDLTSEYVYTWAAYAIERSAAAENNGQPNDFARNAFEALVAGRKDIEDGNDPSDHAQTALNAWEKVVAVNVIHYINSMEGALSDLDDGKTVAQGDIDEGAWGEAKAFAWNLQFYSDKLNDSQLSGILEDIGNDPPYGEMEVSGYEDNLEDATQTIANAYDFNASNVANW
jgi:hypothetical protein